MFNKNGFEGWYFKHQKYDDMVAFIPGTAKSGSFIQMISQDGARQFDVPFLKKNGNIIKAGRCIFSTTGCKIDLPGVNGEITYGKTTNLQSDIMGPFRFLPMECRHGVISMAHTLTGSIKIDDIVHSFDNGIGYIEKDSGTSFPKSYQWLHCNIFEEPCSIMVSVAHIPFGGIHFTGCICAIVYKGHEYRLATYNGVRILNAEETHILLKRGKFLLEININPKTNGHSLLSPAKGKMNESIRERINADIHVRFWQAANQIFDLKSHHATYEFVPVKY